ncbi:MAG: ATP-binding protein [Mariprofundaceae bacterium]|nr:ATP-binding protein [Mariprofundaceae bacterium]
MTFTWGISLFLWLAWWIHSQWLQHDLSHEKERVRQAQDEIKQLHQQLNIRIQHLDHVMDAIQEIVFRLDHQGMVMSLNQRAKSVFNILPQLTFPQPMVMLYRDSDWLEHFYKGIQALPKTSDLPKLFIKDRVYLPRLSNLGGNQSVLLCIDVTQQHQLQEQRKAFTANLMHDLKTPLTSLLGYARSIESFYDDEAICKESAAVIAQEAKHVNELLNSLLSVEEIEYASSDGETCDAAVICQQVWQGLEQDLKAKGLTLLMELPESCHVGMQGNDVHRIMLNIAANAIHYTKADSHIYCTINESVLVIEDEGLGVPEKDLPHLCERFYRVDSVRSTSSGHGLGLAIVKETLMRDGGKLTLKNRVQGGLHVAIEFPELD